LFPTSTVGFYTRAQSFDGVARQLTAGSLSSILFPAASKIQHDRKALMRLYKRYLHLISLIGMALSGYLYLVTPDLFRGLFTEKWDTAALYFQIMCISGFIWPISAIMINIIAGVGNSKAYLKVEYIKTILLIPAYIIIFIKGILWFLWVMVAVRCITVYFNAWFISKEINITIRKQLSIIAGYLLGNILVAWLTHLLVQHLFPEHYFTRVILFSLLYVILLAGLHKIFRTGAFHELNNLKKKIQSKLGHS
jgi:O-antigen/teichoic acid export membrane protein